MIDYVPLILLVIGAMLLHNVIIWRSKAIARRRMQNPMMVRMTTNQRWQHLNSADELHHPGFYRLCTQISVFCGSAEVLGMGEHLRSIIHRIAGAYSERRGILDHVFYIVAFLRDAG